MLSLQVHLFVHKTPLLHFIVTQIKSILSCFFFVLILSANLHVFHMTFSFGLNLTPSVCIYLPRRLLDFKFIATLNIDHLNNSPV